MFLLKILSCFFFFLVNRSPLFYANTGPIASILIESGASIGHKDDDGLAALHSSAERGNVDVCRVLIEKGADVNILDNQKI